MNFEVIFLLNLDFESLSNVFDDEKKDSIHDFVLIFLSRSLHEHEIVLLGELLSLFSADLSLLDFVYFVPY